MELIIDKGFLESFFTYNSLERHKAVYDDFIKFVRKLQPGFKLISNFATRTELNEAIFLNPLLEILIEKNPVIELISEAEFTSKFKQPEFYENSCSLKLFLVDFANKDCTNLEAAFGYSFISGETLAYKWKPFFSEREDLSRCITTSADTPAELCFDSWAKLEAFKHPLNSVLIVDGYLLSDKSQQRIDQNLKPLLKSILPKKKNTLPIDITIITEEGPKNSTFLAIKLELEEHLKSELPDLVFDLSIIKFDKNIIYKIASEGFNIHDRRIITNYFWLESGIGFNIMNDRGKVKNSDSFMTWNFNLIGQNYNRLKHILKGYAAYSKIATEVYGSNQNRLLTQFHTTLNHQPIASA